MNTTYRDSTARTIDDKTGLSLQQTASFIESFDFSPVLERLINTDKWKKRDAILAIDQYKRFLFLIKKHGSNHHLPPSLEIDEVWHAHILHTENYHHFCIQLFGHYLHHHPQLANRKSVQKSATLFEQTQQLHKKEFGDYIYQIRRTPLMALAGKLLRV